MASTNTSFPDTTGIANPAASDNAATPNADATSATLDTVGLPPTSGTLLPHINVRPQDTTDATSNPAAATTHATLAATTVAGVDAAASVSMNSSSALGFSSYIPKDICVVNLLKSEVASTSFEATVGSTVCANASQLQALVKQRIDILWEVGATITYSYMPEVGFATGQFPLNPGEKSINGTPQQQAIVDNVLAEWFLYANVQFQRVAVGAGMFTISFINWVEYSGIGNTNASGNLAISAMPRVTVNLPDISHGDIPTDSDRAAILHTFGHILGLVHEHRSPANGGSLTLDSGAIQAATSSLPYDAATAQKHIVDLYNNTDLTNYAEPDHLSIMRYFGTSVDASTITDGTNWTARFFATPPNFELSDQDKAFMVLMYPRRVPLNTAPQWTIDRALGVFGVDADTSARLTAAYAQGDYLEGRTAFMMFLMNKRDWKTCAIAVVQSEDDTGVATAQPADGGTMNAVVTLLSQLWDPAYGITYSFLGGTAVQRAKVSTVLQKWFYAHITFTRVASNGNIRIAFNPDGGSWSYVGKEALDVPMAQATMNLGWVESIGSVDATTGLATGITANEQGTILHEFGHVLGLKHEHQSPARGGKLTLDEPAVYEYYERTQNWSAALVKSQIIDVYSKDDVSNYSELDLSSVMMYFMPKEMNLQRIEVPVNNNLSDMDIAYATILYPGQTQDSKWTLDAALTYAKVPAATAKSIKDAAAQGNIPLVRTLFTGAQEDYKRSHAAPPPDQGLNPDAEDDGPGWCMALEETSAADANPDASHGVVTEQKWFWTPGDVITYTFLRTAFPTEDPTEYRRGRVEKMMRYLEDCATIRFVPLAGAPVRTDTDFVGPGDAKAQARKDCPLRIAFGNKARAYQHVIASGEPPKAGDPPPKKVNVLGWSRIGAKVLLDPTTYKESALSFGPRSATMWLGGQPFGDDAEPKTERYNFDTANGTLYHEFLHLLGFVHEHISPYAKVQGAKLSPGEYLIATTFDPDSVMLYENKPYLRGNGRTHENCYPSGTDLALLRIMYPDKVTGTPKFHAALKALGWIDEADATEDTDKKKIPRITETILASAFNASKGDEGSANAMRKLIADMMQGVFLGRSHYDSGIDLPFPKPAEAADGGPKKRRRRDPPSSGTKPPAPGGGSNGGPDQGVDAGGTLTDNTALQTVQSESAPGFLYQLVAALKQFFNPGENQQFTLQFPGRYLDLDSYAWDTGSAGIYGQFVKPTAVNEAEFRLVDQMIDVQDVVVGPNGTNLSIIYEQVLNNNLPKFVDNGLFEQQDQIRRWLLKDVPMTQWVKDIMERQNAREKALSETLSGAANALTESAVPDDDQGAPTGTQSGVNPGGSATSNPMFDISSKDVSSGETLNRIELSELLMNEYLYAKQDWELERDTMINNAMEGDIADPDSQKKLNMLTRQLAHITDTRQQQLAAKYADAVVRGYSHTVRRYMGYLDIMDPAEALQRAKDSLRESSMSSLDGSMRVYPVQMTPLDWFQGLSTNFKMEDLTQDVELIRTQIDFKSQEIDNLNAQLVALQMNTRGDPAALQKSVQDAQDALDDAQSTLAYNYSNNVIELAKTYLENQGGEDETLDLDVFAEENGFEKAALEQLPAQLAAVSHAQQNLTAASRALSAMLAAQALAEGTDTRQRQEQLSLKIRSLTDELRELQSRWKVLAAASAAKADDNTPTPDPATTPLDIKTPLELPPDSSAGGSRWQTLMFTYNSDSVQQMVQSDAKATSSAWSCNIWFASGSGSSTTSAGGSKVASHSTTSSITLAMRATLVTVDRGGWFQPQFFSESKAFYKINPDITWNDGANPPNGLLCGFPIGYLIVKDVMIRIIHTDEASDDTKRAEAASSTMSGGILCFSGSKSSSSSSSFSSSNFTQYSNGYIVRIPGPQILGYMMQKTDGDEATLMPSKLPDNFFVPDDEYDSTVNGVTQGVKIPAPGNTVKEPETEEPMISASKMREVLDRLLNEKIGELFGQTGGDGSGASATAGL
ncbi:ZnMc domain-containing protein [Mycena kentingensis (nom. inval.)]|nr:ZnMc domain-containing protein [Mycena kentingensis (nom. inval.)]